MKHLHLSKPRNARQAGFTIVETLIALTIFSLAITLFIESNDSFFRSYYTSLTKSSAQNTVLSISNNVEQSIEYSSASTVIIKPPAAGGDAGTVCAGGTEFVYFLGEDLAELQAQHSGAYVLYEEPVSASPSCPVPTSWSGGESLLGPKYRIITFGVSQITNPAPPIYDWAINIEIAYTSGGANNNGDDLLCSPTVSPDTSPGGCAPSAANLTSFTNPNITCKSESASDFCDVAGLQSIIESRLP